MLALIGLMVAWRQVRVSTANPVVVGARPGEIFRCRSRPAPLATLLLRWPHLLPFGHYPLTHRMLTSDLRRIVLLNAAEPSLSVDRATGNGLRDSTLRAWITAINDAAQKRLVLAR